MALAFVAEAVDLFVGKQGLDGVGELKLAACAGCEVFEHVEDARGEDVAADDGVIGGGVFEAGLLNHVGDVEEAWVTGNRKAVEDAV